MNDNITRTSPLVATGVTIEKYQASTDQRAGGVTRQSGYAFGSVVGVIPEVLGNYLINLRASGWNTSVENSGTGNKWLYSAEYPADLTLDPYETWIPDPVWEVEVQAVEKNLLECTELPFMSNLSAPMVAAIEVAVKNGLNYIPIQDPSLVSQLPNALTAFHLKQIGVEGMEYFRKSIKRTLTCSNKYNPNWLETYDNKILSKQLLVSYYNVPQNKAVLLPEGDTTIQTDANNLSTFQGYQQIPAMAVSVPPNKTQYIQTWIFNKWSVQPNGLYAVAS